MSDKVTVILNTFFVYAFFYVGNDTNKTVWLNDDFSTYIWKQLFNFLLGILSWVWAVGDNAMWVSNSNDSKAP